jgi:hypothetical protein
MALTAQVALIPGQDHRRASRRRVDFAGFAEHANLSGREVRITDLSVEGCRLADADTLAEGAEIWLKISDYLPQRALVAWVADGAAGCEFSIPLSPSIVDELLRSGRRRGGRGVFKSSFPPRG